MRALALALLCLAWSSTACALDFTPIELKASGEGGVYSYLAFRNDGSKLTYMPPKRWEYHGEPTCFSLIAPEAIGAEIRLEVVPLEVALAFDPANLKVFEALARRSLPVGVTKVETIEVSFNPMEVDGLKTVEVRLRYNFFGQVLKGSYLYLARVSQARLHVDAQARASSLLVFRVAAPSAEFERLRLTFHGSLHSLAGL